MHTFQVDQTPLLRFKYMVKIDIYKWYEAGVCCCIKDRMLNKQKKIFYFCTIQDADVVFSAPHKIGSHIKFAREKGIQNVVFNSREEIKKIVKNSPSAR